MNFVSGSHMGRRSAGLTAPIKPLQVEEGGENTVIILHIPLIITPLAKRRGGTMGKRTEHNINTDNHKEYH